MITTTTPINNLKAFKASLMPVHKPQDRTISMFDHPIEPDSETYRFHALICISGEIAKAAKAEQPKAAQTNIFQSTLC